jgi:hypothetical protein
MSRWCLVVSMSVWSAMAFGHVPTTPQQTTSPLGDGSSGPVHVAKPEVLAQSPPLSEQVVVMGGVRGEIGLALTLGAGLNICAPRGDVSCTDLIPGPFLSGGFEYRFWRMGIGLNYALGRHCPLGTGSENVSVSTQHFTFDVLGYFPVSHGFKPFAALGFGYGQLQSKYEAQQSSVAWRSLWQSRHLRAGLRRRLPAGWLLHSG